MAWPGTIDESERVAREFWAESRRRAEEDRAISRIENKLERLEATMRQVWLHADGLAESFYSQPVLRWAPQDLDEWLAEDNPHRMSPYGVPGVLEALGLR